METNSISFMFTLPDDMAADVADIKRLMFTDISYAEMYRYLIRLGLDSHKAEPQPIEHSG